MTDLAALRELVQRHRPRVARDGYPDAVRASVVHAAIAARARGVSVSNFAARVGLAAPTLQRWVGVGTPEAPVGFVKLQRAVRPVDATAPTGPAMSWVTPSGHRIEGLSIAHVAELLRSVT